MLLQPQHPPARDFLFHEGGIKHQFHAVGARAYGERLSGKPFPTGRGLEAVEARLAGDLLQ